MEPGDFINCDYHAEARSGLAMADAAASEHERMKWLRLAMAWQNLRARRLVEMGLATADDGNVRIPVDTLATLERQEGKSCRPSDGETAWFNLRASECLCFGVQILDAD